MAGHRTGTIGVVSALIFNASLVVMPVAALGAWRTVQAGEVYGYASTGPAKKATRRALEEIASHLIPPSADKRAYWSALVQREIDDGDAHAARGLLLCAPTMLSVSDANSLQTQLPPDAWDDPVANAARDDRAAAAALGYLDDEVRGRYVGPTRASDFLVLGDLRDLSLDASAWVQGQPIDEMTLILSGVGLALTGRPGGDPGQVARVRVGASVVKIAKRTGKLSPRFSANLRELLFAAAPPDRLKANMIKSFASTAPGAEEGAVLHAFQDSVDPLRYAELTSDLEEIFGIERVTDTAVAARLLETAAIPADLRRLRLDAEAGGDRALLIAKRAGASRLLDAAQGSLQLTPNVLLYFGALVLAALGFVLSTIATLIQSVSREWDDPRPQEFERDYLSPSESQI